MKRIITIITLFNLCACSLFVPSRQTISITTTEENSDIYVNGEYLGKAPITTKVKRNQDVSVLAKKEGFYPAQKEIDKQLSTTGILDALGTCIFLLPALGFISSGAWSLEQTNVTILMNEK